MRRDEGFTCKKRHHPDGLHLSTSTPKRLLSIDSSIDSADDSTTPGRGTSDSAHGSLWNSASSAVITSDCSTSMSVGHSTVCTDVVGSVHPSFTHSQIPSASSSFNAEASKSARASSFGKEFWMYRLAEGTASESECSDVTHARTSRFTHEPEGVSSSGKTAHIISRREKSSLNSKWGTDEAWAKDAFGFDDTMLREKQLERNSLLHSMRQRRENAYLSIACDSGSSCATGDFLMKEIRPNQGSSHIYGSAREQAAFTASPIVHTTAEALVGLRGQERSRGVEQINTRQHLSVEVDMHPSFTHKGSTEDLTPAYVLSSGRLSLEEEAKLGRRAPTIDHDFEEYFSSLLLE